MEKSDVSFVPVKRPIFVGSIEERMDSVVHGMVVVLLRVPALFGLFNMLGTFPASSMEREEICERKSAGGLEVCHKIFWSRLPLCAAEAELHAQTEPWRAARRTRNCAVQHARCRQQLRLVTARHARMGRQDFRCAVLG